MRSANLFGPLKGLCPHKALIGLTQATGLAGGFDMEGIVTVTYRERREARAIKKRKMHKEASL